MPILRHLCSTPALRIIIAQIPPCAQAGERIGTKLGINLIGAGAYLPEHIISNDYYCSYLDTSDEWITSRTGINIRHAATHEMNWEMGAKAAKAALEQARVAPEEIDLVICTTVTVDYLTPATACLIARALQIPAAACFDLNAACAAFVYAVDMAEKYLSSGAARNALIVSSEMLTKIVDYEDRSTCVLFGDGAGAAVLHKGDGLYAGFLGCDPEGAGGVFARGIPPSDRFREEPFSWESDGWTPGKPHAIIQNGREVYKFATRAMPHAIREACARAGITLEDLAWIFPHQANLRIIETAAKNLGLPMDRFYINIQDHGNISSACIPVCLAEAAASGALRRGDKICLVGFGAGLVYAACVMEY